MADRLQVVYEIQAKVDRFEDAINKTKNNLKDIGQEINNVNKTGKAGFGGLGGIAGSLSSVFSKLSVAIIGVAGAIQSLRQGIESLVVLKQLEVALKNAGLAGDKLRETLKALEEEAGRLSDITGIDDETIIKMYQLGIQMGLTADQTRELTKVSLNVARAFGLDFENAMTQVIRVLQTGETFLTRYDSKLKALIETKADNAEIVEHLTKTYGGMAEEVGKIDVVQKVIVQFNNLLEQVGITLYPIISAVLDLANAILQRLQPAIQKLEPIINAIASAFKGLAFIIGEVFTFLIDNITKAIDFIAKQVEKVQNMVSPTGATRLEAIVKEIDRLAKTKPTVSTILEKYATTRAEGLVKMSEQAIKPLFDYFFENEKALDTLTRDNLRKILDLYLEYQKVSQEISKQTQQQTKLTIDTKPLLGIKREVVKETQAKKEEDIYALMLKQIQVVAQLAQIDRERKSVSEQVVEFYRKQVETLGQMAINGKTLGELQRMNAEELKRIQGENLEKTLQLLSAYQNLISSVDDLAKLLEKPAEKTEEWQDKIKRVNADMNAVFQAFSALASEMGEQGRAIQQMLQGISQIGQAIEDSFSNAGTLGVIAGAFAGMVGLLGGIVNLFTSARSEAEEYVSSLEEGNRQLEIIKGQLEVINILQQSLVEGSEAWVENERNREQILRQQLETLKQQLGIQGEINAQDIANRKSQEIANKQRLEGMLQDLRYVEKLVGTTFFGLNMVGGNAWNVWAGVVNALRDMGKISEQTRKAWLDNWNITVDVQDAIRLINGLISDSNSRIEKYDDLLRIANQLQGFQNNLVEQQVDYRLKLLQAQEKLLGNSRNAIRQEMQARQTVIQAEIGSIAARLKLLAQIKSIRRALRQPTDDIDREIEALIRRKAELEEQFRSMQVSFDDAVRSITQRRIQNFQAQIQQLQLLLQNTTDEVRKAEIRSQIVDIQSKIYETQLESLEDILKYYEQQETIAEKRNESTDEWMKKQKKVLEQMRDLALREGDIIKAQEIEIRLLDIQEKQQQRINRLIDERISKMQELVGLGILDLENVKDVANIIQSLRSMGLKDIEIATKLQGLGVRAGGMIQNITQNWNVSLMYASQDLFSSFVNRSF